MTTYLMWVDANNAPRTTKYANGVQSPLDPRYELWRFTTAPMDWRGDGPQCRQLALALLADATGFDAAALLLAEAFAHEVLARHFKGGGDMDSEWVIRWALSKAILEAGYGTRYALVRGWEDDPYEN